MRSDLNKVLVEDPRRGGDKFTHHRNAKLNSTFGDEAIGGKESMMATRRRAKGDRKRFGDHLAPLHGLLRKNVGRNWDDVYSEICTAFNKRKVMNDHILQHIFDDFVAVKTKLVDGAVFLWTRWGEWEEVTTGTNIYKPFYVHPITGLLCSRYQDNEVGAVARAKKKAAEAEKAIFRVVSTTEHLFKEEGVWYLYKLRKIPQPVKVYVCPGWWSTVERLNWPNLTLAEQERCGKLEVIHPPYKQVSPSTMTINYWNRHRPKKLPAGMYYASKVIASKKYLRAEGLLGDNEFKAADGKMSHRTMSKYR